MPVTSAEQHGDVAPAVQRRANRIRDVRRRQARQRDLIQQRLEQVVVQAIDDGDLDRAAVVGRAQRLGRGEAAEPGADDDHPLAGRLAAAVASRRHGATLAANVAGVGQLDCDDGRADNSLGTLEGSEPPAMGSARRSHAR